MVEEFIITYVVVPMHVQDLIIIRVLDLIRISVAKVMVILVVDLITIIVAKVIITQDVIKAILQIAVEELITIFNVLTLLEVEHKII